MTSYTFAIFTVCVPTAKVIEATSATIKVTSFIVVLIVAPLIICPLWRSTCICWWRLCSSCGCSCSSSCGTSISRIKTFTCGTILGIDVITTTCTTIPSAFCVIVFIITPLIICPLRRSTSTWRLCSSWRVCGSNPIRAHILFDPVQNMSNSCIHSWIIFQCTSITPTYDTCNNGFTTIVTNKRSTRISLASVLSSNSWVSSTDHGISNRSCTIIAVTLIICNGWYSYILQCICRRAS